MSKQDLGHFDEEMPEEINRILTDRISDYLFVTEQSGVDNLKKEGTDETKVFSVGNVMIDTLIANMEKIDALGKPYDEDFIVVSVAQTIECR